MAEAKTLKQGEQNPTRPGTEFVKTIERGPNVGDRVRFRVAPSGKPYPTQVLRDRGSNSTLRDNPGVRFSSKERTRAMAKANPMAKV